MEQVQYKKIVKDPIKIYPKKWLVDGRGGLTEILRNDSPGFTTFGQVYATTLQPGIIKGLHLHEKQTDRIMLLKGLVRFIGISAKDHNPNTSYSNELYASWTLENSTVLDLIVSDRDPCVIEIPPQIWHAFQNIGKEEAYIVNVPDLPYDYKNPDEIREDPHSPNIDFPWNIRLDG